MLIDAHTHILLDADRRDQTVDDLLRSMDRAGIDRAAVFATTISDLHTSEVVLQIARHRDRLFAVGTVSPLKPGFDEHVDVVERWLAEGLVSALKFYTGYEHFHAHDARLRPWLERLAAHGRPAIFHMGDCYDQVVDAKLRFAHPMEVDELAVEMPDLKIVIAHLAPPWVETTAQVCYKNPNVYADCSGFVYGGFDERHERLFRAYWRLMDDITCGKAHEKILFGSDWPISDQAEYVALVRDLAGEHHEAVFSGNARKLFGL